MNHKENFDSPVDVKAGLERDRERERERKPMEKSADGPAAIFFCFKRLIRLCRRSWQFLSRAEETRPWFFSPSSYLMQHASSKRISAPILRSTRLPAIFDGNVLPAHGETGENYFSREKERLKEKERERQKAFVYLSAAIPIPFYRALSNREIRVIHNFQFHRCVSPLYDLPRVIVNIITNINGIYKRTFGFFRSFLKRTCQLQRIIVPYYSP